VRGLYLAGPRQLVDKTVPALVPDRGEVIVKVAVAGIGGSEYLGYLNPGIRPLPGIMGHGIAGTNGTGHRVLVYPLTGCGSCEYCDDDLAQLCEHWSLTGVQTDGGMATHCCVQSRQLAPMPAEMSWAQAVFVEPFANSVNGWERAAPEEGQRIGIIGAGSLGLGVVACAAEAGNPVDVAEPAEARQKAALELGAQQATVLLEAEYDVVFDTVGSEESRRWAINHTRRGGKTVFLGFATPELTVNMSELIRHQKQLIGSFVYSRLQFARAMELALRCDDRWVTFFGFENIEAQLQTFAMGDFECVKAAFSPEI